MQEIFGIAIDKYQLYIADSFHIFLFYEALLYIMLCEKDKKIKKLLLGYSIIFACVYFCPVTAKIIMDYCIGRLVYWRMMWLLPMPAIIAFAGTRIWENQKKRVSRLAVIFALVLFIGFGGYNMYYKTTVLKQSYNLQKLPPEALTVADIIRTDFGENGDVKAVVPEYLSYYLREYDSSIMLAYGRYEINSNADHVLVEQLDSDHPDYQVIASAAREENCDYLVCYDKKGQQKKLEESGFSLVEKTYEYAVYRDMTRKG